MIQKHNFILFTDGSCKENPGTIGAVAFSCTLNGGEKKLDCKKIESSKTKYNLYIKNIPKITNNVAEYEALTFGLEYVIKTISEKKLKNNDCFIEFNTDSNLVVKQIEGKWNANNPHLVQYRDNFWEMLKKHNIRKNFSIYHRKREHPDIMKVDKYGKTCY